MYCLLVFFVTLYQFLFLVIGVAENVMNLLLVFKFQSPFLRSRHNKQTLWVEIRGLDRTGDRLTSSPVSFFSE